MNSQKQDADTGAIALQAGRDVIVHHGLSSSQMSEIMVAVAAQLSVFQNEARKIADERIGVFQQKVLERFSDGKGANPDAFADPDFQYLLGDAQEAVARSGDDAVRDTLVDIIARRSLETTRSRLAITLDDAARRAANLTVEEFSALSLIYLVRYTINHGINNLDALKGYITKNLLPFAKCVSRENSSFQHIQAQSCGSIEISHVDLDQVFKSRYGGVLGKGIERHQADGLVAADKNGMLDKLLIPCLLDRTKLQPKTINLNVFVEEADNVGVTEQEAKSIWSLFEDTIGDVRATLTAENPEFQILFDVWKETSLKAMTLTTTGIAIAHANAVREIGFNAELNVWIK